MSWGPTNWSLSGVPMSMVCQQSAAEPAMTIFGRLSTHSGGDPEQEKDYTYRQESGWAFLDPRPARKVYSATPKKSQWSPNKESRNYAAAGKQASKRNMNKHRKPRALAEQGDQGQTTQRGRGITRDIS